MFYVLLATPNSVQIHDSNMIATGVSWAAPARARGLAVVSAIYGRALTGDQTLTGDVLLIVCKEDEAALPPLKNRLFAFRADGTQIGTEQDISWIDAALDNSSQGGTQPGPHEFEAIVVDEVNNTIYIGDEAARAVYSVKLTTPETSTSQGTVFGRAWTARGEYVEIGMPTRSGEPWYPTLSGSVNDPPKLRPEGMTFRNGLLYVAGDWNETQNQVAVYGTSPVGALTYQSSIQLPITNPPPSPTSSNNQLWGPEGLTFNTGATGFGAGAMTLVTVEDAQYLLNGNTRALLNPTTGLLSAFGKFTSVVGAIGPDDIAFGPLTNRFYVLGDPDIMQVWTTANPPAYANSQFLVATRSKGVTVISPAFARFLLNNDTITQEVLLVVAKSQFGSATTPNNRLVAYTTSGGLLGTADLLWTRDAFPGQPLQEFECIAVDETNKVIYIGDEKAGGIFVLTIPSTAPTITTAANLPAAAESTFYSQLIVATGGTPPYTFTVMAGSLPQGLTLQAGGLLSGTLSECGAFNFTIQVADSAGPSGVASRAFDLSVLPVGGAGDVTRDGHLDGADVQGFVMAVLGTGTGIEECGADMNGDFAVNSQDVPQFVTALLSGF
ncbi:MAG: putative Ig domain-containing protein [Planctomycetes bacterium]|nr:putative Ig domain-containing protein [Planctomycetota bacterium]